MTMFEFLSYLRSMDIELSANGDRLHISAPKGVVTPSLRDQILARKAELLAFLRQAMAVGALSTQTPIAPAPRDNPLPLSFAQQRLWFLDQLEPNSPLYNIASTMRLSGPLEVAALQQAFETIIVRHEALRTTFIATEGNSVQVINNHPSVPLPVIDLSTLPGRDREAEMLRLATEEARRPFNLTADLMLRATVLRLGLEEHVLLLTLHHIASDAWSMDVLFRELSALYLAFSTETPSPLPELPIQYADFALWQPDWLQGEVLVTQLAYWKQQLDGELPTLALPLDGPRPRVQSFRSGREILKVLPDLSRRLRALSQREEATLFMTLLAAFKLLLFRYTGQDDIIVGSPIAGRTRAEIENLIGCFLNTLALRTDLSGDIDFRELLKRVREVALGAYTNQDIPFEYLLAELCPERDLNRTPLFQVFFNLMNSNVTQIELPGLAVEFLSSPEIGSKFDLTLYVAVQSEELTFSLVYNADLFTQARMAEMLAQYEDLLEQIVAAPDRPLGSYSLVTARSRHLLPDPKQALPEPVYELLPQTFMSWASRNPQHPAISQDNQVWTYEELAEASQALTQLLLSQGLERGEVVAVCGSRSFGLIAGIMSVFLSGGVLLTLDQNLPTHRHQVMLQTAKAKRLLYVGARRPEDEWMEESLDLIWVEPGTGRPTNLDQGTALTSMPLPELGPDDAAYIFYTSGTTGVPKGILGCHKGLAHFLSWQRQTFEVGPQDRSAQLTGLSFDVVLRDIFLPLTSGATLCLPAKDTSLEPAQLLLWLERERISLLHTVPSLVQSWLIDVPAAVSLRQLRWVFSAGEPLTETLICQWRKAFPKAGRIVNIYGPTETTLAKCFYLVPTEAVLPGVQPVGSTLPETQALILTKNRQLCGISEPGEIVIRTPFRSLGYINAPEENEQRFVRNPFRADPRDLLYYTGDRGRYRPDGLLEILGRLDHQVKIRGVRIEPGEVSAVLSQHPAVHQAAVVAWEDGSGQKSLVAYIVPIPEESPTISDLSRFLRQRLPDYMVPSAFVLLESLPLTPNGKVDRRALPAPETLRSELEETFVPPRNPTEAAIAAIWAELLGLERVGIHDNFFELGGHSLIAVRLFAKIKKTFSVDLSLAILFETPTIAQFAELLQDELGQTISQTQPKHKKQRKDWSPLVAIQPKGSKPPFFCVHGIHGNVLVFSYLARHLGVEQPFYGLQAQGADGKRPGHRRLEDMAALYVEEIRSIQPEGPYYLGGYSMGGEVAFEMAQQLLAQGQEVGLLVLLDTGEPGRSRLRARQLLRDAGTPDEVKANGHLPGAMHNSRIHKFLSRSPNEKVNSLIRWTDGRTKFIKYKIAQLSLGMGRPLSQSLTEHYMAGIHNEALLDYTPKPYPGRITLFRAVGTSQDEAAEPAMGWSALAQGGLELHLLDGPHEIVEEPYVQVLAEKLRLSLAQGQLINIKAIPISP